MNKFKQMIAITLILALICSVSVSAFFQFIPIFPVVLAGQSLSIESAVQPARVYIFDLATIQEASLSIYQSYPTFLLTQSHGKTLSPMDASDEWDYGDTTIAFYLQVQVSPIMDRKWNLTQVIGQNQWAQEQEITVARIQAFVANGS